MQASCSSSVVVVTWANASVNTHELAHFYGCNCLHVNYTSRKLTFKKSAEGTISFNYCRLGKQDEAKNP